MNRINFLIICLLFLTMEGFPQMITLHGKAVELFGQTPKPIANTIIKFTDIGRTETDENGIFSIKLPESVRELFFSIDLKDYMILHPFKGKMNLAFSSKTHLLEIIALNEKENKALKEKVGRLQRKLDKIQKTHGVDHNKLVLVNKELLDSIQILHKNTLVYERQIGLLKVEKEVQGKRLSEKDTQIAVLEKKIDSLQNELGLWKAKVTQLTEDLERERAEKLIRQQDCYKLISADLNHYLSKLIDLKNWLPKVPLYAKMEVARREYDAFVQNYNEIRNAINQNHQEYISMVQKLWDTPFVHKEIEATYTYLLEEVHRGEVLAMDASVWNHLRGKLTNKKIRLATANADKIQPTLEIKIQELKIKVQHTNSILREFN